MPLTIQAMPGCCGIRVLVGFPFESKDSPTPLKTLETEFKTLFEAQKDYVLIASLIEKQLGAETVLRSHGFRQVSSTLVNPNSSNRLWVFLYDKKELKKAKKSVFKRSE